MCSALMTCVVAFFSFLFVIEHMMPLCMVISWVYSVAMMIQHIVAEKEHRLKEVNCVIVSFIILSYHITASMLCIAVVIIVFKTYNP